MAKGEIRIVGGPGKFGLVLGLFDGKRLEFTIDNPGRKSKIAVLLASVESVDGSRENWNIKGVILSHEKSDTDVKFNGYYTTCGCKGCIQPAESLRQSHIYR